MYMHTHTHTHTQTDENIYKWYNLTEKKIFKKKKIPTYLPTSKILGRETANKQFFKDGPGKKI